jgi:hypothetical protein
MEREGDQAGATGAEAARRAAVLRPLVQAYLTGSGSLESGIRDALWELGVSRATVWRWIRRLAAEGGRTSALVPQKRGRRAGITVISSEAEAVINQKARLFFLAAIAAAQKRPLVKAALFSADGDDFSRVALLRAYQKEPRLIAAVDHIAWRLAQRLGPSGLTGTEPTAAKSHN